MMFPDDSIEDDLPYDLKLLISFWSTTKIEKKTQIQRGNVDNKLPFPLLLKSRRRSIVWGGGNL